MDEEDLTEEQRERLRQSRAQGRRGRYVSFEDRTGDEAGEPSSFEVPDWMRAVATGLSEYGSTATLGLTRLAQGALESVGSDEDFGDARSRIASQAAEDREEFPTASAVGTGLGVGASLLGGGGALAARGASTAARAAGGATQAASQGGRLTRGIRATRDALTRQRSGPAALETASRVAGRARGILDPAASAGRQVASRLGRGGAQTADRVARAQGRLDALGAGARLATYGGQVAGRAPQVAGLVGRGAAEGAAQTYADSPAQGDALLEDVVAGAQFGSAVGGVLGGAPAAVRGLTQGRAQQMGMRESLGGSRQAARAAGEVLGESDKVFAREMALARADARMFGATNDQVKQLGGNAVTASSPRILTVTQRALDAVGDSPRFTRGQVERDVNSAVRRLGNESDAIISSFPAGVDERVNNTFQTVFRLRPDPKQNALARTMQGSTDVVRQEVRHPEIQRLLSPDGLPSNSTQSGKYMSLINDRLNQGNNRQGVVDYESFRNEMRRLGRQGRYDVNAPNDDDQIDMARRLYAEFSDLEARMLRESGVPQESVDRLRVVRQQQNGALQAAEWLQNKKSDLFSEFWKARFTIGATGAALGFAGATGMGGPLMLGAAAVLGAGAAVMGPAVMSTVRRDVLRPLYSRLQRESPHVAAMVIRSANALESAETAEEREAALRQQAVALQIIAEDDNARAILEEAGQRVEEISPGVQDFLNTLRPQEAQEEISFEEYMQNRNTPE